jgi:hypothetical protein
VQVIAEVETTPADSFALLLRYPPGDWRKVGGDPIDIDGHLVGLRIYPNGSGEASWELADGTFGYLRSRGLAHADIVEIIESVIPAPADATFPGFRIDFGGEPPRFQSLHEGVDTDVSGTTAGSDCEAPALDGTYPLTAVAGDPLFQYGAVIDRHVPLEVGYRDGTLLMVHGGPDVDGRPTVADAVDADDERWATLLTQPN